ncbi:MAG: DUF309 domain-containing protein, partial [Caldilineaceae bacterium]|nr:DUF309 domain-containing protein [Caldilineaceae bacterium]
YAEAAIVPAWKLAPLPDAISMETAAAVMLQGLTAHYLTRSTFPLQPGNIALVHAAAGGVGLLLVQMAKQCGARVIGTVSTEEKAALARAAGADHAWARSKMTADLVDVVKRHVSPPVRYPTGWDDRLSAKAQQGVHEFNRGEFFEQHELFEEAWLEEPRPIREMYQGILQVGVAFYLIEQDNWAGAVK